ncbi:peptide deformylase [Spirilliplanes yamanashiensis]|uniref:Peptide deformylase n=1 Tax=Spirilliplanes yamanashiensis TaxID=42233 RepID=A0A8J3Y9Z6_9ACTN|nr:peptide deformylase [Spirilliplanes yamanashiensis]MDP9817937.1 peptide deformylase [Spirilliplanes yamanashiensis]GIJ04746.1 peptide deformylase [Spirilliplanes yamanashiensis]
MTMRAIRLFGDAVLRTPTEPVTVFDAELRALVTDLMDTLTGAPGRAGVAAPQIGVSARVFVYDADGARGHVVNPVLSGHDGEQDDEEGCLSLPGLAFPTPRAMRVTVTGADQHGEPLRIDAEGFLARAMQHETDHLDGRLYVDTLRGDARKQALREIRKVRPARG